MRLCKCGEHVSSGRRRLGLKLCLACGEIEAQLEIKAKQKRVSADYNKGGLVYQGDAETARRNIKQAGKKSESLEYTVNTSVGIVVPREVKRELIARKAVGVYYIGREAYVWYNDLVDPKTKGATRQVRTRR